MKLYENKSRISEQHVKADHQAMDRVPDGLWIRCPKCHQVFLREKLGIQRNVVAPNAVMAFEQVPGNGLNGLLMISKKF